MKINVLTVTYAIKNLIESIDDFNDKPIVPNDELSIEFNSEIYQDDIKIEYDNLNDIDVKDDIQLYDPDVIEIKSELNYTDELEIVEYNGKFPVYQFPGLFYSVNMLLEEPIEDVDLETLIPQQLIACNQNINPSILSALYETFLSANVPLEKLDHPSFKHFLQNYCKINVCNEPEMRHDYLRGFTENAIREIRSNLNKCHLWVGVDDLNENVCVVIGNLYPDKPTKRYFLGLKEAGDAKDIFRFVKKSLTLVQAQEVSLLVTSGSCRVHEAGELLARDRPNLIHTRCLVQTLHTICECVLDEYDDLLQLIFETGRLWKSEYQSFVRKQFPDVPNPPHFDPNKPSTWIENVEFYFNNYQALEYTIRTYRAEVPNFRRIKNIWRNKNIRYRLALVKSYCGNIPNTIQKLKDESLPLTKSMELFQIVLEDLRTNKWSVQLQNYFEQLKNDAGLVKINQIVHEYNDTVKVKNAHFRFASLVNESRRCENYKTVLINLEQFQSSKALITNFNDLWLCYVKNVQLKK